MNSHGSIQLRYFLRHFVFLVCQQTVRIFASDDEALEHAGTSKLHSNPQMVRGSGIHKATRLKDQQDTTPFGRTPQCGTAADLKKGWTRLCLQEVGSARPKGLNSSELQWVFANVATLGNRDSELHLKPPLTKLKRGLTSGFSGTMNQTIGQDKNTFSLVFLKAPSVFSTFGVRRGKKK